MHEFVVRKGLTSLDHIDAGLNPITGSIFSGLSLRSVSSSFASSSITSSFVISSSVSVTSSYSFNAFSSSYATSASWAPRADILNTGSLYPITSSWSEYSISSSYAFTSSWAQNLISASYALTCSYFDTNNINTISGSAFPLTTNRLIKWNVNKFANSGFTDNGSTISTNETLLVYGAADAMIVSCSTQGWIGFYNNTTTTANIAFFGVGVSNSTIIGNRTPNGNIYCYMSGSAGAVYAHCLDATAIYPGSTLTYDLGKTSAKWRTGYFGQISTTGITGSLQGNASTSTTASYSLTASYFGLGSEYYLPRWQNNNTLSFTSSIYNSSSYVGIIPGSSVSICSTSSFPATFYVNGNAGIGGVTTPPTNGLYVAGQVGIGAAPSTDYKVHVKGDSVDTTVAVMFDTVITAATPTSIGGKTFIGWLKIGIQGTGTSMDGTDRWIPIYGA